MAGNDQVIEFTPEPGFTIEGLARHISQMMRDLDMDARILLPGQIHMEIPQGTPPREIVKEYKAYIAAQMKRRATSNLNLR